MKVKQVYVVVRKRLWPRHAGWPYAWSSVRVLPGQHDTIEAANRAILAATNFGSVGCMHELQKVWRAT